MAVADPSEKRLHSEWYTLGQLGSNCFDSDLSGRGISMRTRCSTVSDLLLERAGVLGFPRTARIRTEITAIERVTFKKRTSDRRILRLGGRKGIVLDHCSLE